MHIIRLLILFFLIPFSLFAQDDDWFLKQDSVTEEYCYVDKNGNVKIPFGKYEYVLTDTFKKYAMVWIPNKVVAIDKNENILYTVLGV